MSTATSSFRPRSKARSTSRVPDDSRPGSCSRAPMARPCRTPTKSSPAAASPAAGNARRQSRAPEKIAQSFALAPLAAQHDDRLALETVAVEPLRPGRGGFSGERFERLPEGLERMSPGLEIGWIEARDD